MPPLSGVHWVATYNRDFSLVAPVLWISLIRVEWLAHAALFAIKQYYSAGTLIAKNAEFNIGNTVWDCCYEFYDASF